MTRPWYNHPPEQGLPMLRRIVRRAASRPLTALVALLAVLGLVLTAAPASAVNPKPTPTTQAQATALATLPSDASGYKFWSPQICVQSGVKTTGYPIAYAAQQWNVQAAPVLKLDHSYDCAADGYPPSRRFTVGVYSAPSDPSCLLYLNTNTAYSNGFYRWTDHPVIMINYAHYGCVGTTAIKNHFTSMAIGAIIGMTPVNWPNSLNRVMNAQSWSVLNVPWATATEGQRIWEIYSGSYCNPSGSVC